MIKIAERETSNGIFIVKDLADVETLDYMFDGILAQAVLLHIPKAKAKEAIQKMTNKLKKGGYLYVAVKTQKTGRAEEEVCAEEDYGYRYERFFSFFSLEEIKNHIRELGLDIVYDTATHSGRTNWVQVIAQKN